MIDGEASWCSSCTATLCWSVSAATTIVTAIVMLAAVRSERRMRRATSRTASSSGTGRRAESAISDGRRRGGWAGSLSARIVLVRAPRIAGTIVAHAATTIATIRTSATEVRVSGGVGELPSRPLPRFVSTGAISWPTVTPTAVAASASRRFSASSTTATNIGVAPTALSSPTRRVCSAIRLPTTTAMLAIASSASSVLTISRTF